MNKPLALLIIAIIAIGFSGAASASVAPIDQKGDVWKNKLFVKEIKETQKRGKFKKVQDFAQEYGLE